MATKTLLALQMQAKAMLAQWSETVAMLRNPDLPIAGTNRTAERAAGGAGRSNSTKHAATPRKPLNRVNANLSKALADYKARQDRSRSSVQETADQD